MGHAPKLVREQPKDRSALITTVIVVLLAAAAVVTLNMNKATAPAEAAQTTPADTSR